MGSWEGLWGPEVFVWGTLKDFWGPLKDFEVSQDDFGVPQKLLNLLRIALRISMNLPGPWVEFGGPGGFLGALKNSWGPQRIFGVPQKLLNSLRMALKTLNEPSRTLGGLLGGLGRA